METSVVWKKSHSQISNVLCGNMPTQPRLKPCSCILRLFSDVRSKNQFTSYTGRKKIVVMTLTAERYELAFTGLSSFFTPCLRVIIQGWNHHPGLIHGDEVIRQLVSLFLLMDRNPPSANLLQLLLISDNRESATISMTVKRLPPSRSY